MTPTRHAVRSPRPLARGTFVAFISACALALSCGDAPTAPLSSPLQATAAPNALSSATGGSAQFTVGNEIPLQGQSQAIGYFPMTTVVAIDVQQAISISMVSPYPPGTGFLGLAGRIAAFGCTHQGEAYMVEFYDGGGYDYAFAGCQLAGAPDVMTSFRDTVAVTGTVVYGYSYDSPCTYPDQACAAYSGSSSGAISVVPATGLEITGDSVSGGMLRAFPTREYALVAKANPERMGRFLTPVVATEGGWKFKPDVGPEVSDVCSNGSARICTATFQKAGTLTLTAYVNGTLMTSSPLRIEMPTVSVALSRSTARVGDTVEVTTTLLGAPPTTLMGYNVRYYPLTTTAIPLPQAFSANMLSDSGAFMAGEAGSNIGVTTAPLSMEATSTLPNCQGTWPAQLRCFVVLKQPGRAMIGAFVRLTNSMFLFDEKPVIVSAGEPTITLTAAPDSVAPGDSVYLTTVIQNASVTSIDRFTFAPSEIVMADRIASGPALREGSAPMTLAAPMAPARVLQSPASTCLDAPAAKCLVFPSVTGDYTVEATADGKPLHATVHVKAMEGVKVEIVSAKGPNDGSFLTRAPENVIELEAKVTPSSLAASVKWEVLDAPDDEVTTRKPATPPADGVKSRFTVPASNQSRTRWPALHPGSLTRKSLAYIVTAIVTVNGKEYRSKPQTVRQDEHDTLRQEYVDWDKARVLARAEIGALGDAARNSGDYSVWPSSARLLEKMPVLQALAFTKFKQELTVTGGFRNPVHHHLHAGAHASESQHLYGAATDFRIVSDRPAGYSAQSYFFAIRKLAWDETVGGCFEPERTIIDGSPSHTLDHVHIDWRQACPAGWGGN